METKLVVILGAGPVGQTAARMYKERGLAVRFVTRSGKPMPEAETVAADIADADALTSAAEGASILLHAAGVPYHRWFAEFPLMQSAVLSAAERLGAVAVFAENLYSYAADTMPMTETSEEKPATKKGALRLKLSQQWLAAPASGRVRAVSVRASDYWGPGATDSPNSHFGARFFPGFEAGKPVAFLGNPDALHSFAYLPDFARALVDASLDEGSWGRPWIAPAMGPTTSRRVAELFAAEAGLKVKVQALPPFLLKVLGLFHPLVREVSEMLYQFEKEFVVDTSAWTARFGWKATPLDVAVRETWEHRVAAR